MTADPGTTYWCAHAWLNGTVEPGVVVETGTDGRITGVRTDVDAPPPGAEPLRGLTLPGLANAHSHAFHRALRGTVQVGIGHLLDLARHHVPDRRAAHARTRLLRARPRRLRGDGARRASPASASSTTSTTLPAASRYDDPNAMGHALIAAAAEAGHPHHAPGHLPISPPASAARAAANRPVSSSSASPTARPTPGRSASSSCAAEGGARAHRRRHPLRTGRPGRGVGHRWSGGREEHSGAAARAPLRADRRERRVPGGPRLHPDPTARRPRRVRARTTAVHATHLTAGDIRLLGGAAHRRVHVPHHRTRPRRRHRPGPRSCSARAPRCRWAATATPSSTCWRRPAPWSWTSGCAAAPAATGPPPSCCAPRPEDGHAALGWPEAGRLETGALADFTTVALDSVRTAGPAAAVRPPRRRSSRRRRRTSATRSSAAATSSGRQPRVRARRARRPGRGDQGAALGRPPPTRPRREAARTPDAAPSEPQRTPRGLPRTKRPRTVDDQHPRHRTSAPW